MLFLQNAPGVRKLPVTQRKFGVELEHGNPRLRHEGVLKELKKKGYPTSRYAGPRLFQPPTCYTSSRDGSGVEIRTPALKGLDGLGELEDVITDLVDLGGYTTDADGMHVHHQARDYYADWSKIQKLANTWIDNRKHICSFVARGRWNRYSCPAIDKPRIHDCVSKKRNAFPRGDLNFSCLRNKGTIEIRLHEGTLNADKAVAWVVFGQALISTVSRYGGFKEQKSREDLLDRLGIADKYAETLLKVGA